MTTIVGGWVRTLGSLTILSLLAAVGGPQAAAGQVSTHVELLVWAGAIDAHGELPDAPILDASPSVLSYGELPTLPVFGVALELSVAEFPVGLRVGLARSLQGERTGQWSCAPRDALIACPSILIEVPTDMATTIATADFVGSVPIGRASMHPLIGVSLVHHAYRWDPTSVGSFSLQTGAFTTNSAALHVGLGVSAPVGSTRFRAEYSHHYSGDDTTRPSQLGAAVVGVVIPLR